MSRYNYKCSFSCDWDNNKLLQFRSIPIINSEHRLIDNRAIETIQFRKSDISNDFKGKFSIYIAKFYILIIMDLK